MKFHDWLCWPKQPKNCILSSFLILCSIFVVLIYAEKLKEVNLLSLYDRRRRGDLIQVWKKLHGQSLMSDSVHQLANVNPRFTRCTNKPFNLAKQYGRLDIRKNFYSVRVVEEWNKLPTHIQNADTLEHGTVQKRLWQVRSQHNLEQSKLAMLGKWKVCSCLQF